MTRIDSFMMHAEGTALLRIRFRVTSPGRRSQSVLAAVPRQR
jgi:hypothetical protein